MSGYDIKVYDPKRLTGDDAKVMEGFELYRQVARDIRYELNDLLHDTKIELTVSLMEAEPERYAAD